MVYDAEKGLETAAQSIDIVEKVFEALEQSLDNVKITLETAAQSLEDAEKALETEEKSFEDVKMEMDELLKDITKELLALSLIRREPVYTLAECLDAKFADDDDDDDADDEESEFGVESPTDAGLADVDEEPFDDEEDDDYIESAEEIQERFRKTVYHCDEKQLAFLRLAVELTEEKAFWENDIDYYPFRLFIRGDFIYLFGNDGKYRLVIPEELILVYREVMSDPDFASANARNRELIAYATALIKLYGMYKIEQFVAVWNHHHKDKITTEEAMDFHSFFEDFAANYYLDEDYAIHHSLDLDESEELFDRTYQMAYYLPTKSVIREYARPSYSFGYDTPDEDEMDDFLRAYIQSGLELEGLKALIVHSCLCLYDPEEVRAILERHDAPIGDPAFVAGFESRYNAMRNNCHIWDLRGNTIYQYRMATGVTIPGFRLVEE